MCPAGGGSELEDISAVIDGQSGGGDGGSRPMLASKIGNVVVNNGSRVVGHNLGDGRGHAGKPAAVAKVRAAGSVRSLRSGNNRGGIVVTAGARKTFEKSRPHGSGLVGAVLVHRFNLC